MKIRFAFSLVILSLISACAWVDLGGPEDDSINATVISTDQAVDQFLTGRDLDPIEGAWVHDENGFEIIIAKNTFNIAEGYDYVGVITRSEQPDWHTGEVKLLLRKTAADDVFEGTWTARNKAKTQMKFVVEHENLVQASFRAKDGNEYFVRIRRMSPRFAGVR